MAGPSSSSLDDSGRPNGTLSAPIQVSYQPYQRRHARNTSNLSNLSSSYASSGSRPNSIVLQSSASAASPAWANGPGDTVGHGYGQHGSGEHRSPPATAPLVGMHCRTDSSGSFRRFVAPGQGAGAPNGLKSVTQGPQAATSRTLGAPPPLRTVSARAKPTIGDADGHPSGSVPSSSGGGTNDREAGNRTLSSASASTSVSATSSTSVSPSLSAASTSSVSSTSTPVPPASASSGDDTVAGHHPRERSFSATSASTFTLLSPAHIRPASASPRPLNRPASIAVAPSSATLGSSSTASRTHIPSAFRPFPLTASSSAGTSANSSLTASPISATPSFGAGSGGRTPSPIGAIVPSYPGANIGFGPAPDPALQLAVPAPSSGTSTPSAPETVAAHRNTPYRPGFQPKGAYRVRTEEFVKSRRGKGEMRRLEDGRMARRLEKLMAIHFPHALPTAADPSSPITPTAADPYPLSPAHHQRGRTASLLSGLRDVDLEELRRNPGDFWASIRGKGTREERSAEQLIVKWQDDSAASRCPICMSAFSLTNRKHHCRLCGRVVCASSHAPNTPGSLLAASRPDLVPSTTGSGTPRPPARERCSLLITAVEGRSGKVEELKESKESKESKEGSTAEKGKEKRGQSAALGAGAVAETKKGEKVGPIAEDARKEEERKGVRICRDCWNTVSRVQYMVGEDKTPTYVKLYDALMRLQRDIEDSLPEFQEMVLGLQKQDSSAALGSSPQSSVMLQREAAAARKRLLANFADYDALARRIRSLLPETPSGGGVGVGGDKAKERVQLAIWTRANLFLQTNMFFLQSLPKLLGHHHSTSVSSGGGPRKVGQHRAASASVGSVRSLASLLREGGGGGEEGGSGRGTLSDVSSDSGGGHPSPGGGGDGGGARGTGAGVKVNEGETLEEAEAALSVLLEQERLVSGYVKAANRARKFDDAKSLKRSLEELRVEIARRTTTSTTDR